MGGREGERGREREGGVIVHDIINNNKYKYNSLLKPSDTCTCRIQRAYK